MRPQPLTVRLTEAVTLRLESDGEEIVATLSHGITVIPPIVRAVANSERVRTKDGALHIGRTQFYIPTDQRIAVRDFLAAAQAAS